MNNDYRVPAGAFTCKDDRKIMAAMRKLKGMEWVARELSTRRYEKYSHLALTAGCIKAGECAFPEIHNMLIESCEILGVDAPLLYIKATKEIELKVIGEETTMIMLSSGVLDILNKKEQLAFIAHAVSHLNCAHAPFLMMRELAASAADNMGIFKGAVSLPRMLIEEWNVMAEYSADRGALLVVKNVNTVLSMLCKLASGGSKSVTEDALLKQDEEYKQILGDTATCPLFKTWSDLYMQMPRYALRAGELKRWAESDECKEMLAGNFPQTEAQESELSEDEAQAFWGEFSGTGAPWEATDISEDVIYGLGGMGADGIKQLASQTGDVIKTGLEAAGCALNAFVTSIGNSKK